MSDYISEDYLFQIFKWLPVKTLLRFRCVCKCWKEIIDSQSFLEDHLAIQKPRLILEFNNQFLLLDPQTLPSIDPLILPPAGVHPEQPLHLVGTHHGLICLYNEYPNEFLVSNISIFKCFSLSVPRLMRFDWRDHPGVYSSFWIDPSTKMYKIIAFKLWEDEEFGFVFSSIKHDCKLVPLGEARRCQFLEDEGKPVVVMIRGMAYWRALHFLGNGCFTIAIISFDFVQERFEMIEMPSPLESNHNKPVRYDCSPSLHFNFKDTLSVLYWGEDDANECKIYSMQEQGKWVNMFRFKVPVPDHVEVLWALDRTEETCRVLVTDYESLVLCDSKDGCNSFKRSVHATECIFSVYELVESLLFPYTRPFC